MKRRHFIKSTLGGIPLFSSKAFSAPILEKSQSSQSSYPRKRVRELGIKIGDLEPGPYNAITDVTGVKVGHTTIIKGKGKGAVRTGVTVILPHEGNIQDNMNNSPSYPRLSEKLLHIFYVTHFFG